MTEKVKIERKKEFTYRGNTIEELKQLDIREFAKFIPSRERRSLLRNSESMEMFLAKCRKNTERKKKIRVHNRNIIVVPKMIGLTIEVYNGQIFEKVGILPEMIGHRLGEFSQTRKNVKHGSAGIGATKSSASRSVK